MAKPGAVLAQIVWFVYPICQLAGRPGERSFSGSEAEGRAGNSPPALRSVMTKQSTRRFDPRWVRPLGRGDAGSNDPSAIMKDKLGCCGQKTMIRLEMSAAAGPRGSTTRAELPRSALKDSCSLYKNMWAIPAIHMEAPKNRSAQNWPNRDEPRNVAAIELPPRFSPGE